MKAIRVHSPGPPEALKYEEVARPEPKPGEALVKIDAAGVNFIDTYFRAGAYPAPMPLQLGVEAAGTVVALGGPSAELKVGDPVAYAGVPGAYAEYSVV